MRLEKMLRNAFGDARSTGKPRPHRLNEPTGDARTHARETEAKREADRLVSTDPLLLIAYHARSELPLRRRL